MSTKDGYRVPEAQDVPSLVRSLNFIFQSLADRMDKIEGVRGTSTVLSDFDLSGNALLNVGNFDQYLGTGDTPTFGGLTIGGDLAITGLFKIEDSNGTVIHQMSDT